MENIQIVLVEPQGPLNVGSIARVMKNFGLKKLVLVHPQCDPLSDDALKMAVHAKDVLEQASVVNTLREALQACPRAIATTVRERMLSIPLETPKTVLPWLLETNEPVALVFGSEDRGLSNEEMQLAPRWLRIPTHPGYPTLNLSQSVALCCYELFRHRHDISSQNHETDEDSSQSNDPVAQTPDSISNEGNHPQSSTSSKRPLVVSGLSDGERPASLGAIEQYLGHLEAHLLEIGYLYPHTQASRIEKFRRLLHRANPSETELALLRGVISQMEWALKNRKS